MSNIAIVPVTSDLAYEWIAGKHLLCDLVSYLNESRDLDFIEILSVSPERTEDELGDYADFEVPLNVRKLNPEYAGRSLAEIMEWFHKQRRKDPKRNEDNYLGCSPMFPYLTRSKIEQALYSVLMDGKVAAVTVMPGGLLFDSYICRGSVVIEACMAIRGEQFTPNQSHLITPVLPAEARKEIPVTVVEAVDCSQPAGQRLANALEIN